MFVYFNSADSLHSHPQNHPTAVTTTKRVHKHETQTQHFPLAFPKRCPQGVPENSAVQLFFCFLFLSSSPSSDINDQCCVYCHNKPSSLQCSPGEGGGGIWAKKKHPSVTRQTRKAASHSDDAGRNGAEIFFWGVFFQKHFQNCFSTPVVARGPAGDFCCAEIGLECSSSFNKFRKGCVD